MTGPLLITEIFHSVQGESSHMGRPYVFVRLAGCNLRCTYCDTAYAFKGGKRMSVTGVVEEVARFDCQQVLITGGEPLLQRPLPELVESLNQEGYQVSIETHGEVPLKRVAGQARIVMDIKTPGSRMSRGGFRANFQHLLPTDEIKFVITSPSDYAWSKEVLEAGLPTNQVWFSPALPATDMPGKFEGVSPRWLADRILKDRLPVNFQLQLHKLIWGENSRGV